MGELLLTESEVLECTPAAVFEAIAAGELRGWQLAGNGTLRPGTPVTLPISLPATMGGRRIEVIGRVRSYIPAKRLIVDYHLPWRGSIFLSTASLGSDRCRVRLVARLEDDALPWLQNATGVPRVETSGAGTHRLGLLMSSSGPASVFASASQHLAVMAVDEVNSEGGICGTPVRLFVGDDGTQPALGAAELVRLAALGCRVVLTNVTSVTMRRLRPIAKRLGLLLIYTPVNEGGSGSPAVLHLGERPLGQLRSTVPGLMRMTGADRWYLAGNDYSWPRVTNQQARRVIERHSGLVLAERYEPLGSRDFSALIDAIESSGAELVISTFVGADEVAFEQQVHRSGLRRRIKTLSLALDESTCEHIGPDASTGLWTAFSYFQSLNSRKNQDFLRRYHSMYGTGAPPVSSISESVYEAVRMYVAAARAERTLDHHVIGGRLRAGVSYSGPRGDLTASGRGLQQPLYLGRAGRQGISVVEQTS